MTPDKPASDGEPTKRTAKPKTVGSAECPECMNRRVGVIKIWDRTQYTYRLRDHDRITRSGHRFPCPASGRRLSDWEEGK